jgi:hypothetical protein
MEDERAERDLMSFLTADAELADYEPLSPDARRERTAG